MRQFTELTLFVTLCLFCVAQGCRGSTDSAAAGVVVRQVLRGDEAKSEAPAGAQAVAPLPTDTPTTLGTTVVSDTPQAIYRQAQERSRRTIDADNMRQRLTALSNAID